MSQIDGVGWSDYLIAYDTNRFVSPRFRNHRLDKVTAFAVAAGDTIKTASSNKKVLFGAGPDQEFTGKLGGRIDT